MRPHAYILQQRIHRAGDLLLNSESCLVDIALSVGFRSQSHFTTIFKQLAGETPHRWRQLARRDRTPEASVERPAVG